MKYFFSILILFTSAVCTAQEKITTEELPSTVNGRYQDVRPIISDDGSVLYINRRFHPGNIKGEKDFQDVWETRSGANNSWSKPKNLGEPYNDKKANDLVRASASGDSLVFVNADYKGVGSTLALFYKNEKRAQEMEIDGYYNKSPYVDFDVNFKDNVILMAVERKDTEGNQDLYYSIYQPNSKTYSTPMTMGKIINSNKADFAPFLTNDGYTLFFASYRDGGQGGADLYMSQRQSDAWDDWSEPENLGNIINSPYEETFVSIDPSLNYLYYDSYPSGASNRNIWRATLSEELKAKIKKGGKKKKVNIAGVNASTDAPLVANFGQIDSTKKDSNIPEIDSTTITASETSSVFSGSIANNDETSGALEEDVVAVEETEVAAQEVPEDLTFFEKIGQKLGIGVADETIELLNAGKKGKKINKNVYFKFDSDKLQSKFNGLLSAIAKEMEANPNYKLMIEGHTDGIGGEDVNKDLSCRRSRNVKQELVDLGINANRLEISCEGKERPIATNDDEFEGRELNRRVEFYFF
ncbi:hypothetical protein GCM10027429_24530 [Marivirga atlantica]|uniref:OmpA family protein n=1 Tax=Marivirga atlantica TaxID=1548457 RepID=A0A937DHL6_9BACT|nr:OmpA family protein [Marivirga atlantica]MBL0766053.1 OmpA family protein [Marivirga atlantica]